MTQEEILDNIRIGSTLTLNRKTAHLDKYTNKEISVDFEIAEIVTRDPSVQCWGGNFETGDKHFEFKNTKQ